MRSPAEVFPPAGSDPDRGMQRLALETPALAPSVLALLAEPAAVA